MQRLALVIAILLAFASLAGTTLAHAHRYVSTPIVVLNHVDSDNRSIPVVVELQRGEIDLGAGIMLPCGSHQAIPVSVTQVPLCPPETVVQPLLDTRMPDWPVTRQLRPPRQA